MMDAITNEIEAELALDDDADDASGLKGNEEGEASEMARLLADANAKEPKPNLEPFPKPTLHAPVVPTYPCIATRLPSIPVPSFES